MKNNETSDMFKHLIYVYHPKSCVEADWFLGTTFRLNGQDWSDNLGFFR